MFSAIGYRELEKRNIRGSITLVICRYVGCPIQKRGFETFEELLYWSPKNVSKIRLFKTFYLVTSYEFISNKGVKFIMKLKEAFWKSKWAYQGIKTFKGNNFVQKYYFLYSILSINTILYYMSIIKRFANYVSAISLRNYTWQTYWIYIYSWTGCRGEEHVNRI